MTREQEIKLLRLIFDRNNEVHDLVMSWLLESLEELNQKRALERR